jgi:hypothetical protein
MIIELTNCVNKEFAQTGSVRIIRIEREREDEQGRE